MDIELVICTYNRSALLQRTLEYLDRAERPENCSVGILVVLNACTDDSPTTITRYAEAPGVEMRLPLRWVAEPRRGKSFALNRAIELCEASVMAFVDDDHRVDPGYLVGICKAAKEYPDISIFCGRILPDWDGREPAWVHVDSEYAVYPLPVPRYDLGEEPRWIDKDGPLPGGGNLFMHRAVFARVGGFSSDLGPKGHNLGGGEDSEFMRRALEAGETLQYVPDAVQHHYVDGERLRLGYLIRKSYQRSLAVTQLQQSGARIPPRYLWRKLGGYLWQTVTSLYWPQTRFYMVRTAATLGELGAYLKRRPT
ncbi:MAG: glycosyltransferase [Gammaproteobacteria bacterium]